MGAFFSAEEAPLPVVLSLHGDMMDAVAPAHKDAETSERLNGTRHAPSALAHLHAGHCRAGSPLTETHDT